MAPPAVVVFVDYQNAHKSGHTQFCDYAEPVYECLLHPRTLADTLVAKRAPGGTLKQVRVYRGRPDPRKEPTLTSANDKQKLRWEEDPRVHVKRRPLRYPDNWGEPDCYERPQEKGVDVSLAVDMVRMAIEHEFEVGIVFSRDTDLLPAIETIRDLGGAHVEVGTWEGTSRLRLSAGKPLYCHHLSEEDFRTCRDTYRYLPPPPTFHRR